ncbi:MAG: TIGR02099 family protein [Burkholderiales bacterium]|nr:TIGR02099 family protein [Burkholderiales bacterium]
MTELTPNPSPLLRVGVFAVRAAFWLVASAWVALIMVWGGLHFVIVPRIDEFRPTLEQQVSRMLGVTVRVGDIEARSNGLIPSLELKDVRLLDAQGRETLKLPLVLAALSARSIMGLDLEQLTVDRPELDIRRTADGRIWVAGIPLPSGDSADSAGADWVFSQPELVIRNGTVTWTDELRGEPSLALTDVDWVLRNQHRTHAMRLDANPPAHWGGRLSVSGIFRQPLLSRRASLWREWDGQLYANFAQVDLAELRRYADLGVDLAQGSGSLRAWVDVRHGGVTGATADLALDGVKATLSPKLEALALRGITGRLGAKVLEGGFEVSTQALQFETQDGLRWPGGNVRLTLVDGDARKPAHGELVADRLDLAAMAQIAQRLPLPEQARITLQQLAPKGLVEQVQASWQGPPEQPSRYSAKGRVAHLEIAARALADGGHAPGFRGANLDFDLNQSGGKATVALQGGTIDLPGIFEDPLLHFDQFSSDVQWKLDGQQISLNLPNLRFSNADAQGEAQLKWQTAEGVVSGAQRFPGLLDLQGSMSRADGTKVHRYLPLGLPKDVRDYVRDAVTGGVASGVKFKVKGNLHDFPYNTPRQGDFRISADVHNATFAYVPAFLLAKDSVQWPALTQLSGELVIDRNVLRVLGAHGGVAGQPGLRVTKADGVVDSLYGGATVTVTAEAQGPVPDILGFVNGSPLGGLMGKALEHATASGSADYRFKLAFPIAAVDRATVRGSIALAGNDLQVMPDTPRLTRTRGSIAFSESGFSVTGAQARALGGDVRIDGGLYFGSGPAAAGAKAAGPTVLRMQGTASADGLRQARELGFAARLAQYANGSAAYTATLGFRGGVPELQVNSSLVGMGLSLPAPFTKAADSPLPLRLDMAAPRGATGEGTPRLQDQLQLDVGKLLSVVYVRDVSGAEARVLRGAIGAGLAADESAPLPADGVVANVNLATLDTDAWSDVLSRAAGADLSTSNIVSPGSHASTGYLPTSLAVRARELTVGGRKLNNVVIGGGRDGALWRANVDASELNGYVEYRQPQGATGGRLYGRLARLAIAPNAAQDVESVLDEQPASIPALDIVVEDLELRGKKLGRVEIEAVNLGASAASAARDVPREWRLNRFNIITPEAVLTASGNWTNINAQGAATTPRSIKERRRTVMNFKLDIADSGELLNRFGMKDVVRRGKGLVEGQVAWLGSPITLDYPSLGGSFNIAIETGQFLKTDPGIGKLLGVLSLQALPRRLTLDFRDVFSEGFAFDFIRGDVTIAQGIARTNNLQMKGVNAAVLMEGQADIAHETQAIKVVVVPDINAGGASLLASYINPVVGLSTFLAQLILRRPLMEAATQELLIDGTWVDPRVTKVEHKSAPVPAPAKPQESK